jgi:hypothetical protein
MNKSLAFPLPGNPSDINSTLSSLKKIQQILGLVLEYRLKRSDSYCFCRLMPIVISKKLLKKFPLFASSFFFSTRW